MEDERDEEMDKVLSQLCLALQNANPEWETHFQEYGVTCYHEHETSIDAQVARMNLKFLEIDDPDDPRGKFFGIRDPTFEHQVVEQYRKLGLSLPDNWMHL